MVNMLVSSNTPSPQVGMPPIPLEDIITPEAVNIWPPAMGWWILAALVFVAIVYSYQFYRRYQKKWRYRKAALTLLEASFAEWQSQKKNDELTCNDFFSILKRTAMTAYGEDNINCLYGKRWIFTLYNQAPKITKNDLVTDAIINGQYKKSANINLHDAYGFCKQWIIQHEQQWLGEK